MNSEFRVILESSSQPQQCDFPIFKIEFEANTSFKSIQTERLHLRSWSDEDIFTIHSIMQDPEVNYYLQKHKLDQLSQIQLIAKKSQENILKHGYGYFICESRDTGKVIGMVGLNHVNIDAEHFPCYTISWIFGKDCWGKGYATEAARALIKYGFEFLNLPKIFACTTWNNTASEKVMKRLEMNFIKTFEFPGFEKDDLFCNHLLYVKESKK